MEIAEGTVHLRRRATILGSQDRRTCRRNAMRVTSQWLRRMEIAVGIVRLRRRAITLARRDQPTCQRNGMLARRLQRTAGTVADSVHLHRRAIALGLRD